LSGLHGKGRTGKAGGVKTEAKVDVEKE